MPPTPKPYLYTPNAAHSAAATSYPDMSRHCSACSGKPFEPHTAVPDHLVSHETFQLLRCPDCGLIATDPQPEDLGRYYQSQDYISHTDQTAGPIGWLYKQVRGITLRSKVALLNKFQPNKGALLDVGTGTGYFLERAKAHNWQVQAVEPDAHARQAAIARTGAVVLPSLAEWVDAAKPIQADAITLWHVLEHVPELDETFQQLNALLKPTGTLIIAVPNHRSADAAHYGTNWAAWDVPRHLYHFSPEAMQHHLRRHGFALQDTRPMPFDAYYVSLLSERYRGSGIQGMARAALQGLRSNSQAARTGQWSSLIYVASKA